MTSFLLFSPLIIFFVLGTQMNEFHGIRLDNTENQMFPNKNPFEVDFGSYSMLAYVPARICHVKFQNESGTFSPPASYGNMDIHLWCNWTILAGPGKHIVIYIKGFRANLNCDENRDEIIFEGVSSNAENSVAYACWNKHTHVYAAEATAVHVVFLWRSFSYTPSSKYFEGKYYVFEDPANRNDTRPQDCVLQPPLQEKVIKPISEPPTSAILDITQDKNSTPSVYIDRLSETDSFEPSFVTPVKYQTFIPSAFDVTSPVVSTYSLHNIKESTQTINEESFTRDGNNGDYHSMAQTHLLLHKSGTTEQIAIPSSIGLSTLEDSVFTSQVPSEEPSSISSFPDQHENLVPSATLQTSDVPYILETADLTPKEASIHSPLHPTEGGTTTMNREEILVSSYGEHLLPETHFTSSGLYFKELKSTPVILHMIPEDASLYYSVNPIKSSTSSIKSEKFLEDRHDLNNFLIEATSLSFAWHTGDKTLNKVFFSEAVEQSYLLFSTDHQERNITSRSNTEVVSALKGYPKEVLSETLVSSSILPTEDETLNPSTITSDLVTESEESSLALLLSTDHNFDQFLRQLPFDWDPDDLLGNITPTEVATSQTDLKEATPKSIQEITSKDALTSEEVLKSTKLLQIIMSSFTFNHALLTKVMSKPAIPNPAVPPFTQFTASNEDLPQPISVAYALSSIPPFAKSGLDDKKAPLSPMVTEAHQVASDDTNLLQAFLGFIKPFDSWIKAYKTEARERESIAPAIPETTNSHVAASNDKASKNNHSSGNILGKEQLNPPRIHSSQPTEGRNTMSNISDVLIATTRVIIEEMERSTYLYQSSDSNRFVEEDLRSDKVGSTTYTENNLDMGFSHADGLYAITIEIEHDEIISSELESKIIESTSQKIQEKMFQLPNTESSLLFKKLKRPRDNSLTVIYWLQMRNGGRGSDMADLIETQLNELINSSVATPNTTLVSFSIDGFHILHDHLEILIGSTVGVGALLLSTAVIVICIIVRKKRGKRMFNLQEPESSPASGQENTSIPPSDTTLNLSKPTRCLPTCQPAEHRPAQETTSVLELTKITVEQTAC